MQTKILHLFTRTPLHVGAGSSVGAIDQPVIRERHTGFPIIPGSAIKGVLADEYNDAQHKRTADGEIIFGKTGDAKKADGSADMSAGAISFGEARLLAFPLRSAKGSFALATCPLALARYGRDAGRALAIPSVADGQCLAGPALVLADNKVALEEYVFTNQSGGFPADWADQLSGLLNDAVLNEAKTRFVLLSDGDFSHFAVNACQVQHHNRIDDETGTVTDGALFNTETVPSETLFYAPLTVIRDKDAVKCLLGKFANETLLRFGGDATTGLGFCTVKLA
jgi:CRISPR-associated protein Cmr4